MIININNMIININNMIINRLVMAMAINRNKMVITSKAITQYDKLGQHSQYLFSTLNMSENLCVMFMAMVLIQRKKLMKVC